MLPFVLGSMSSAIVAFNRISAFLSAEELPEPYLIDNDLTSAVRVDGDFTWEAPGKIEKTNSESGDSGAKTAPKPKESKTTKKGNGPKKADGKARDVLPTAREASESAVEEVKELDIKDEEKPFGLKDLELEIAKGSFVAIVGRVGSGKVSDNCPVEIRHLYQFAEFSSPVFDRGNEENSRRSKATISSSCCASMMTKNRSF